MADPLGSVQKGQISPFLKSERTVNTSLELLRQIQRQQGRGIVGPKPFDGRDLPPSIRVLVRNDTGSDLPAFSVVKLGDVVNEITHATDEDIKASRSLEFTRVPVFKATVPAATTDTFAILDEPIPYPGGGIEGIGRAVIQGVVTVDVNMTTTFPTHNFATPTASDETKMTSGTSGPAKILYAATGTGTKRAAVLITAGGNAAILVPPLTISPYLWDIGGDNTYEDMGAIFSDLVLTPGTWLIGCTLNAYAQCSASPSGGAIYLRIYNEFWGYVSHQIALTSTSVNGVMAVGGGTVLLPMTISQSTENIRVEAMRTSGPTWTISRVLTATGNSNTAFFGMRLV